ncbi:myosin-11-like, partial [Stegodyphus dumicola]|uniref:myosin-11-like n=1 Tax=Stegodyphus dumicola TaxID=202533 RepID=UPI0015A87682
CGRVPAYVLKETAGPTTFAKSRASEDEVSSAFKLFIDDDILLHIKKCTESEAHRQLGNKDWKLSLVDVRCFCHYVVCLRKLVEAVGRVQELENHLATTNLELQQCQEALQEKQLYLDEAVSHREELAKQLRECRASLNEARENIDFLQAERSTLAEAFQETEQSLLAANSEMMKDKSKVNELMDRARKLYAKVQDKNLQVQLLRAELDRTQGNCRDMLLSQGAELTMISMHLSQMSMNVHTLLTTAADFAANELALQKEMLEEVMIDLDSEGERSESPVKQNGILNSDSQIPSAVAFSHTNSFSNEKHLDTHKSLPDISAYEPGSPLYSSASSESERPLSLVQSMVRAFEQSTKNDPKSLKQIVIKSCSEQNSDSVKSSVENLSSINGDLSRISSPSKDNSPVANSAFKPIGMATAFRPVRQQSVESDIPFSDHLNSEEEKKISLEIQLNQIDSLVKKIGRVIELMQGKFLSKMRVLNDEKNALQEELSTYKHKQCQLQAELNIKNDLIKNAKEQTEELLTQLQQVKNSHAEEKEKILQKNIELTEKISCLEAVNAEQTEQIKNEVQRMMSILVAEPNSEFLSNAQAICDKLNLKQEIAKLKATISQKEVIIQQLAQKFKRATTTLEEDLRKAEKEIRFLDNVIGKVFVVLQSNPDLAQNHEAFRNLMSLASGMAKVRLASLMQTICAARAYKIYV